MVRLIGRASLALLLAGLAACGGEEADAGDGFSPDPSRAHRVAWLGTCVDGSPLVVEPLAPAHHPELAKVNEEGKLRELLGYGEDVTILRVHSCGGTAGQPFGSVRTPEGGVLEEVPGPAEEWSPRERLIWHAVVRGGQDVWEDTRAGERRSYLIAGSGVERALHDSLDWNQGDESTTLERHSWTERERREYLDSVFAPPAEESETDDRELEDILTESLPDNE